MSSNVFCAKCNLPMLAIHPGGENGVDIYEMAFDPPQPYKGWSTDKLACPLCGDMVYHKNWDQQAFWHDYDTHRPPSFKDGAVRIWETAKQAEAQQGKKYQYVVNTDNGTCLGIAEEAWKAKQLIYKHLGLDSDDSIAEANESCHSSSGTGVEVTGYMYEIEEIELMFFVFRFEVYAL